ncbi:MAG: hypothetical protein HQM16_08500 [Deltaproteobacteria bacterium]|nr:hypothetical protein [Deltaproteobacteria bacterium]
MIHTPSTQITLANHTEKTALLIPSDHHNKAYIQTTTEHVVSYAEGRIKIIDAHNQALKISSNQNKKDTRHSMTLGKKCEVIFEHTRVGDGSMQICQGMIVMDANKSTRIACRTGQRAATAACERQNTIFLETATLKYAPPPQLIVVPEQDDITGNKPQTNAPDTPPDVKVLPDNYGTQAGQSVDNKLKELESSLKARFTSVTQAQLTSTGIKKRYYQNLMTAVTGDLSELSNTQGLTRSQKIALHNRIGYEAHIEFKFNIALTHGNSVNWTNDELVALDRELSKIPATFLRNDPKFIVIQKEQLPKGVAAGNTNTGTVLVGEGANNIRSAIIHEVGHNHDTENPRWQEFLNMSGWTDVTGQFTTVSPDFIDGAYQPHSGSAVFKSDGKKYTDSQLADLDGDGVKDGRIQVQYGRVYRVNADARFVSSYAGIHPCEDFAESFRAFFDTRNSNGPQSSPSARLKARDPEKYAFMKRFTGCDPLAPKKKLV